MKKIHLIVIVPAVMLLFFGTPFSVLAIEGTGNLIWRAENNTGNVGMFDFWGDQIHYNGSHLYVFFQDDTDYSNVRIRIQKRNIGDGSVLWDKTETLNGLNFGLFSNETGVYVGGVLSPYSVYGPSGYFVEKRDIVSGNIIWKKTSSDGYGITNMTGNSSGFYVIETAAGARKIVKFDFSGNVIWDKVLVSGLGSMSLLQGDIISADDDGVYAFPTEPSNSASTVARRYDPATGVVVWSKQESSADFSTYGPTTKLAVRNGSLFLYRFGSAGANNIVEKRATADGSVIWRKTDAKGISGWFEPVVAVGDDGSIAEFGSSCKLYKRDSNNGAITATYNLSCKNGIVSYMWTGQGDYIKLLLTNDGLYGFTGSWSGSSILIDKYDFRAYPSCGQVTDSRDGTVYDTVQIGTQCWMRENMNVGQQINTPAVPSDSTKIEKYCYNNQAANCTTNHPNYPDGGLYQWNEAMQYSTTEGAQGICPAGWHIPTDAEWHTLENYLKDSGQSCDPNRLGPPDTTTFSCSSAGAKLMPNGSSGFEGNIAGFATVGSFGARETMTGNGGYYWSSSPTTTATSTAWNRLLYESYPTEIGRSRNPISTNAFSVRCVQGAGAVPPTPPSTLEICIDDGGTLVPLASGNNDTFILQQMEVGNTKTLRAFYDNDGNSCAGTDITPSAVWNDTLNNPNNAVNVVSGTVTAIANGTESFTASSNGQTITGTVTVDPIVPPCSTCNDEKASHCPTESWTSGCGASCIAGTGTRYCDMNWKEVAPGQ